MNNLKRILSLALATVMVIGMMVVGASAADYPDADEIVNKDAVETLGALGIMNGDERGFRPQDGLTRAEAAKMLTKIHNKGVDVNFGVKDTPTFKDTDGHWAEGIIEYAAAFGIVNGMGNGIFDPQGELTVAQLARMVLNMMGYTEGQTGSDWELKTTVLANNMGLFDDLKDFLPTGKVNRDNAAQILVNAINKPLANGNTTSSTVYTVNVTKADATDAMKAVEAFEFNSAADAILVAGTYGLSNGDYTIARGIKTTSETLAKKYLSLKELPGTVTASVKKTDGTYDVTILKADSTEETFNKLTSDYTALLGRKVTVLYKAKDAVYGINTADAVVATMDGGDYGYSLKSTSNPTGYDVTGATYWVNGKKVAQAAIGAGSIVELINTNDDAKIETVRVVNKTVTTLTADPKVETKDNKTTVTLAGTAYDSTTVTGYEDLKKNDVVLYVTINGMTTFEKADSITGTVSSISNQGVYTVGTNKLIASDLVESLPATDFKTEYNFFLDNGGNIIAIAVAGEAPVAAKEYAVVNNFGFIKTGDSGAIGAAAATYVWQVQLLLPNGETEVVEMVGYKTGSTEYGLKKVDADPSKDITAVTKIDESVISTLKSNNLGRVVEYTVTNGKYTLKEVGATMDAGTAITGGKANFAGSLLGNKDTIFLMMVGTDDDAKLYAYNGVAELPSVEATDMKAGWSYKKTGSSFQTLVYLKVAKIKGVTTEETAYFIDNTKYSHSAAGYEVQAVVDGQVVTLVVEEKSWAGDITTAKGLKKVTYNADHKVTAIAAATTFKPADNLEMASEFVKSGNNYYQIANDAVIYKISGGKATEVAPANIADALDRKNGQYIYNAWVKVAKANGSDTDVITEMYIEVKAGTAKVPAYSNGNFKIGDVDYTGSHINDGVAVAISADGKTLTYTGTLAKYTTGCTALDTLWGGNASATGKHFIAATFQAPAGVKKDELTGGTIAYTVKVNGTAGATVTKALTAGETSVDLVLSVAKAEKKTIEVTVTWKAGTVATYTLDLSAMKWAD